MVVDYRQEALILVDNERNRQDTKWGIQDHEPLYWNAIIGEEKGEFEKAILEQQGFDAMIKELSHIAASAVAAMECLMRNGNVKQLTPLTVEQLMQMDGEPAYLVRVEGGKEARNKIGEGWYLVDSDMERVRRNQFFTISFQEMFEIVDTAAGKVRFGYNAYATKPERLD